MRSDRKKKKSSLNKQDSDKSIIISMFFSLFLVGLSLLFVIGFRYFLRGHSYEGPVSTEETTQKTEATTEKVETFEVDDSFNIKYIMIKNISEGEKFVKTEEPSVVTDDSVSLNNGQILEVKAKGSYKDKEYYRLKDNSYVEANEDKVIELTKYVPLTEDSNIVITYIGSGGVKEHSWLDFDADNVVKSAYVKEEVKVIALVTAVDGTSAFQTEDGLYITTDSRYFRDYTQLGDEFQEIATTESSDEDSQK